MFAMAGKLITKVIKVLFSALFLLNKQKILMILKDLIIVVCDPKADLESFPKNRPTIDRMTITKSKIFHESFKYLDYEPIIFIIASHVKMTVNIKFMFSRACFIRKSWPNHSIASTKVLPRMHILMNYRNHLFQAIKKKGTRQSLLGSRNLKIGWLYKIFMRF